MEELSTHERLRQAQEILRSDPAGSIRLVQKLAQASPADAAAAVDTVRALLIRSRAELHLGTYAEGTRDAARALTIAQQFELPVLQGKAHNELGVLCFVDLNFDEAMRHYHEAIGILEPLQADDELASVYLNIGNIHHRRAEYASAILNYERVLEIAERLGNDLLQAKVLMNMAGFYQHILNDTDAAMRVGLRAAQLYEAMGDKVGLGKAYSNLGFYFRSNGDLDTAVRLHEQALTLRKEFAETDELLMNYHNLATTYLVADRFEDADRIIVEAEGDPYMSTDRPGTYYVRLARGRYLLATGSFEEGMTLIERVAAWMSKQDLQEHLVEVREIMADAWERQGDLQRALDIHKVIFSERLREQRERAEHRLLHLKAHSELEQSKSQAEIERIRNIELAAVVRRLEQASKEKSEYLAFIAHELKNPIGNIRSIADLLVNDSSLSIDQRIDYDRQIHATATRMFDMVSNLLTRARDHEIDAEMDIIDAIPIWRYVVGQWDTRTRDKSIILHTTYSCDSAPVRASEQVLISIMDNLVSNAVKFSPPGRIVTIEVKQVLQSDRTACVHLSVGDQGPGLSRDDMASLFAPFRQLSAKPTYGEDSTGLGLHIVKRDVERINGRIWCDSEAGKGATFHVELPIASAAGGTLESWLA